MKMPWTTNRTIIKTLRRQVAELQHSVDDVLSGTTGSVRAESNPYPTDKEQVDELSRKYTGRARWGNQSARNLVDIRASFIISEGVKAVATPGVKDASRELAWLKDFIDRNRLDDEVPQAWAQEAEIEGRILIRLIPNPDAKQIDTRFVSWTQHGYEVKAADEDYAKFEKVTYRLHKSGREVTLKPEEFVYLRFGGRAHNVNESPPKLGGILTNMEALHKALVDWRKINSYYAAPTPYFKVQNKAEGDALNDRLKAMKWRIGKFLIGTAEFSLIGMPSEGVDSVKSEITAHAQITSGLSGVPMHFLGFPELMSNRSVADSEFEAIRASTSKERRVWIGGYEELFRKAIAMANELFQAGLDPDNIAAEIPEASSAKLKELKDIWFPLREGGEISRETFLGKIPDLDVEVEAKRLEVEDAKAVEAAMHSMRDREDFDDEGDDE